MPIVRQLPQLYIRGSLANETMRNLTPAERENVGTLTQRIASHPEMAGHKQEFIMQLGNTIGADYVDRSAAEAEYQIAIWRGIVNLFYHKKYSFTCQSCHSETYVTGGGKERPLERRYPCCPNCGCVEIVQPGATHFKAGEYVDHQTYQAAYADFTTQIAPTCQSPIRSASGDIKHNDPHSVLQDPVQVRKYFGEFVWNYFRQQIRENAIQTHRRESREILGRADEVAVEEILSEAGRCGITTTYYRQISPESGYYRISLFGWHTDPIFTLRYCAIKHRALQHGVTITNTENEVLVRVMGSAPLVTALVYSPEWVNMVDSNTCINPNGRDVLSILDQATHNLGREHMDADDNIAVVESHEQLELVRAALPDGDCQLVYDILRGEGVVFDDFAKNTDYVRGPVKVAHVARFLKITPKMVKAHKDTIKHVCLRYELTSHR